MVQVDEVIISHAGDIIHYDLVGFRLLVGNFLGVADTIDIVQVVPENGGAGRSGAEIGKHLVINFCHHGFYGIIELGPGSGIFVDAIVGGEKPWQI